MDPITYCPTCGTDHTDGDPCPEDNPHDYFPELLEPQDWRLHECLGSMAWPEVMW